MQAPLNAYLKYSPKNDKCKILRTELADQAFIKVKSEFTNAVLLVHSRIDAEIRLLNDASDFSLGATLEQKCLNNNFWEPLAFFSPTQRNYSAYDRELTAIYEAIKYFKYMLEGRNFKIFYGQ